LHHTEAVAIEGKSYRMRELKKEQITVKVDGQPVKEMSGRL